MHSTRLAPPAAWIAVLLTAQAVFAADRRPSEERLPSERPTGELEVVALFQDDMPTGVTVSAEGRIFVNFPRWEDGVETTVAEIVDGQPKPYPSAEIQEYRSLEDSDRFISVQSVVAGPDDRLWILDTGRPQFRKAQQGGPKLMGVDLQTNKVVKNIVFPADVVLPTTYLNDVRFDLRRGDEGMAFITDSSSEGPNGIIVVDLASGDSWRRLHNHPSTRAEPEFLAIVEGRPLLQRPADGEPQPIQTGSDGIAIEAEGERLFYCPLAGRHLFSVSVDALADREQSDAEVAKTVTDHGDRGFASDGLESDATGGVYLTNYEDNAVLRRSPEGTYDTLAHHPTMLWPDTLSVADDGYLYMTCNQLHRQPKFHGGKDLREKPYVLLRTPIDAGPVRLK